MKKYINSEEKIPIYKLIPQLEDSSFIEKLKTSAGEEVKIDSRALRKVIETEIEIIKASQGNDPENLSSTELKDEYEI